MANSVSCASGPFAGNGACIPVMQNFCSTDDLLGQTYTEKWEGDYISSNCHRFATINAGNQGMYVPAVDAYARRYLITEARPITFAQQGSVVYDPAIEDLIGVCQDYPGGCDAVLNQVCAGYSRADLSANPNLAKLCGCFMSDAEYDKYTGSFGVQNICDPACVLQSAVKPRDPANQFATLRCNQAVCVIDDVTISILGKSTVGDINFGQACASCTGGSGCTCNISDISITSVESAIKNINFDQSCGGPPNCFKRDANGVPQPVPCSALDPSTADGSSSGKGFLSTNALLVVIGIIVFVVVLIIIIALLLRKKNEPPSRRFRGYESSSAAVYPGYRQYSPGGFSGGPLSAAPPVM